MIIEGTLYWCKLDKPQDNYNKRFKIMDKETGQPDGWNREYSLTVGNLTKETKLALRDAGVLDRVKNKMDDQEDFIVFRLPEKKKDGTINDPIKVVNAATMKEWDWDDDGLIANGSKGALKFNIWKGGAGKASIFPVSLLVTEHVLYEREESENDYEDPDDWSAYAKPEASKPKPDAKSKSKSKGKTDKEVVEEDILDDDIPF